MQLGTPGGGPRTTGTPATASAARPSRLYSRPFHGLWRLRHHAKNVGNMSIEPFDKMFGTLIDSSKIAAWVMPAKGG